MGNQFLAGAALAADQHRDLERRDLDDLGAQAADRRALADDGVEAVLPAAQNRGLALVELDLALQRADAAAERIDLLGAFEHHPADRTDDLAVALDRHARDHALGAFHALQLADLGLAGADHAVEAGVLDHVAHWPAIGVARAEAKEA